VAKFLRSTLKGRLIAWDPVARAPRWTVEHDNAWNGGVLSTAGGLVFQGKLNGHFVAYDAATGDVLWDYNVKSGAGAGPGHLHDRWRTVCDHRDGLGQCVRPVGRLCL
jgi:quinohemoprotein ethanol dehydrogenase